VKLFLVWILGLFLSCYAGIVRAHEATWNVIVIGNRNVPESMELARHYMKLRDIPARNLCLLDLPRGEVISRANYVKQLRDPLLAFLRDGKWIEQTPRPSEEVLAYETAWLTTTSSVHYVVSLYGVPLRIADTRFRVASRVADRLGNHSYKNEAAVDSELAMLLMPPYNLAGPVQNPLYNSLGISRVVGAHQYLVMATRLDGPDPASVRSLMDGTMQAERYGLNGRAYFDARGLRGGPYFMGDYWIREAYERFVRAGYECVIDLAEPTFSKEYPMEDVAVYVGWYDEHVSGPLTREDFRFKPGALAYHIHSGSAKSLRTTRRYWTGPLVARGAAASAGAVGEPFLQFTPNIRIWMDRMLNGYPLGEAAYMAQSVLSWQVTIIGDPLYRPFRYSLTEQIQHMEEDRHPDVEWGYLRRINMLVREGRFNIALNMCRAYLHERESIILRERLGDLYAINDLLYEAVRQYERVLEIAESPVTAVRIGARMMTILRMAGHPERAEDVRQRLIREWSGEASLRWLDEAFGEE